MVVHPSPSHATLHRCTGLGGNPMSSMQGMQGSANQLWHPDRENCVFPDDLAGPVQENSQLSLCTTDGV